MTCFTGFIMFDTVDFKTSPKSSEDFQINLLQTRSCNQQIRGKYFLLWPQIVFNFRGWIAPGLALIFAESPRTLYLYFFTRAKFLENKLHRKMPIFRVKSVKNATFSRKICRKCQFFALNLSKFTPAKKNLHGRRPWRLWQISGMSSILEIF